MLVLSRREGESLTIGTAITIMICEIRGGVVRVGITAPPHLEIVRDDAKKREASHD